MTGVFARGLRVQAHARAWAVRADSCRCRTLVESPIFKAVFKPLIGELPVYTMIGLMMPYLFQVSASVPAPASFSLRRQSTGPCAA